MKICVMPLGLPAHCKCWVLLLGPPKPVPVPRIPVSLGGHAIKDSATLVPFLNHPALSRCAGVASALNQR